ncbi:MAG: TetR/AcrR family transcriptional regulator [Acidimicrobiia bacterium]|nr:TetR/AcrR family transcriptional regulator [Acidimicrobiia bacterium]
MNTSRDQTRQDLFAAAIEQFLEFGFHNTSHADIAGAAGIGRTTFYEYFSSMESLLVELVEARLPMLSEQLLVSLPLDEPADIRMAELVVRMVEFVGLDDVGLLLHTEVPRLSDHSQNRIRLAHHDLADAFVDLYLAGCESGVFRRLPPRFVGRLINDVIMAAGREVKESPDPKQVVHDYAEAAATFLLAGLQP